MTVKYVQTFCLKNIYRERDAKIGKQTLNSGMG